MRPTCPTCRKPLPTQPSEEAHAFRPFCSSRCRLADLGSWLGESYKISSALGDEDLDQGLALEGESPDRHEPN